MHDILTAQEKGRQRRALGDVAPPDFAGVPWRADTQAGCTSSRTDTRDSTWGPHRAAPAKRWLSSNQSDQPPCRCATTRRGWFHHSQSGTGQNTKGAIEKFDINLSLSCCYMNLACALTAMDIMCSMPVPVPPPPWWWPACMVIGRSPWVVAKGGVSVVASSPMWSWSWCMFAWSWPCMEWSISSNANQTRIYTYVFRGIQRIYSPTAGALWCACGSISPAGSIALSD